MGIVIGIVSAIVFSFFTWYGIRKFRQFQKAKIALVEARQNERTIQMRDRILLKKTWIKRVDRDEIASNISKLVSIELNVSAHEENVVLGSSYDTYMRIGSDLTTHRVICKNLRSREGDICMDEDELISLRRLTRHNRIAYVYGWKISLHENIISHQVLIEFLERRSLRDLMKGLHRYHGVSNTKASFRQTRHKDSSFSWEQTLRFALDISEGLAWLHDNNVCHGNLHSSNVLVTAREKHLRRAKLTDAYFLQHGTLRGKMEAKRGWDGKFNPDAFFVHDLIKNFRSKRFIDPSLFHEDVEDTTFMMSPKCDMYSLGIVFGDLEKFCENIASSNWSLRSTLKSRTSMNSVSSLSDSLTENDDSMRRTIDLKGTTMTSDILLKYKSSWNRITSRCLRKRRKDRPSSDWTKRQLSTLWVDLVGNTMSSSELLNEDNVFDASLKEGKVEEGIEMSNLMVIDDGAPSLASYPSSPFMMKNEKSPKALPPSTPSGLRFWHARQKQHG